MSHRDIIPTKIQAAMTSYSRNNTIIAEKIGKSMAQTLCHINEILTAKNRKGGIHHLSKKNSNPISSNLELAFRLDCTRAMLFYTITI